MTKAANSIITPDPSGDIHQSRLAAADADLMALGREIRANNATVDEAWARADALQEANPDDAQTRAAAWAIRDGCRPLTVRFHEILNAMRDTPAHTVAGMAQKAETIIRWLSPGGTEIPDDHEDGRVAWSLARDVLRLAGSSRHDGANPDAELIAACERFIGYENRYLALFQGPSAIEDDDARDAAAGPCGFDNPELEAVLAGRPVTLDGLRAMARCVVAEEQSETRGFAEALEHAETAGSQIALTIALNLGSAA